ncbi:MAG: hypothetical protein LUG50_11025 [Planctomycetaceae bacterium]|nr:hypothetical protein [Planctomycetaceae bacterium]
MSATDDFDFEDDEENQSGEEGFTGGVEPVNADDEDDENSVGLSMAKIRNWLNAKRGWLIIIGLAISQAVFASIVIFFRSEARPMAEMQTRAILDLTTELLGHEVKINQIYQLLPGSGGTRMTVGMDVVLILGQLPEERVEGAPRPTPQEMETFMTVIYDMEPRIRSQVNILLQQIPAEDYGTVEVYKTIKEAVRTYVNDTLDGLDFGKSVRPGIGKRRVTDVLIPMFIRQKY